MVKKGVQWKWTRTHEKAFNKLKGMLCEAPVLRHFTPGLPVVLHTDASLFAIGGWIGQVFGGTVHLVAYWSKKLIPAETRYPMHDRELLALH